MKQYSFKPPQERLEPRRWEANVTHNITNYGKYTRNCLLDAKIENADQNVPSYLVTADAIHPLCGMANEQGITESRYGALRDSTNSAATITQIKAVIKPILASFLATMHNFYYESCFLFYFLHYFLANAAYSLLLSFLGPSVSLADLLALLAFLCAPHVYGCI